MVLPPLGFKRSGDAIDEIKEKKRRITGRGSSSATDLPPELWIEVLSRIPVRPLLLTRPTCKLFASLVPLDPFLAGLHLRRHQGQSDSRKRRVMFLEQCDSSPPRDSSPPLLHSAVLQPACPENGDAATLNFNSCIIMDAGYKYTRIVRSCKGVVGAFGKNFAFLCNPATGEWVCFSKPYCTRKGAQELLHIGRDATSGALKVVHLCGIKQVILRQRYHGSNRVPISLTCKICTLDKDVAYREEIPGKNNRRDYTKKYLLPCWTSLADSTSPLDHISLECFHGDGILCWGVRASPSARGFTSILTLNLTTQRFESIPLPEIFVSPSGYTTFQELDGRMCIVFWPPHWGGTIEIWMLKDIKAASDKKSWFLRCCIHLQRLSMGGLVDLVDMWDDGIIYTCSKDQQKSVYYCYDLRLEETTPVSWDREFVGVVHNLRTLPSSNLVSVYEESLAPIITGKEAQDRFILSSLDTIAGLTYRMAEYPSS